MQVRYSLDPGSVRRLTTEELRGYFLIETLFRPGTIEMVYSDIDRSVTGSAVPLAASLHLAATKKELAAEYFTERREIGVINTGGSGTVSLDGKIITLLNKDALYIGRGVKEILFASDHESEPAKFYFVSYPAHKEYPSRKIAMGEATQVKLGSSADANSRTIYKFIHPGLMPSCQIVMGLTILNEGSVWNTMPPHTHLRRSEVYMYFDLPEDAMVVHLMGEGNETRHLIVRNGQAVLSPSWSLHAGAGTRNYAFIWAMGGENQEFDDMDGIAIHDLR